MFLVEAIWSIYRPSSASGTVNPESTLYSLGLTFGPGAILLSEEGTFVIRYSDDIGEALCWIYSSEFGANLEALTTRELPSLRYFGLRDGTRPEGAASP